MTKIRNNNKNAFMHSVFKEGKEEVFIIGAGETKEIPEDVSKIWLKLNGFELAVDEKKEKAKDEEIKAKNEEIEELKAKLAEKDDEPVKTERQELIEQAKELDLDFPANIPTAKLKKMIDEALAG